MKNKNFKILIIDDEPEYQKALSIILEEVGYITAMCSNGKEALDYFNENSADLVITDLRMPVMSGTEVIKAIRERHRHTDTGDNGLRQHRERRRRD